MKKFRYLLHLLYILLFLYYSRINFIINSKRREEYGLCSYLRDFSLKLYKNPISGLEEFYIPEFNSMFLAGKEIETYFYWWNIHDIDSRLKAFNKLINLYKSKIVDLLC